ncbi:Isochorismatase hydrolase [Melanomma pulvis-pyrius CBS 109.77]|uniref:Isochorismatase hydrolase n=1 Tax=Melanomma pulvis-pyrius CBS 109.77 TaxID=1314802 RepID=A0A6A6WYS4_9PLEO|nr:Isochorismatase hydrolase [Melanomma pulvis-pyrius CBS 109.77]
MASDQVKIIGGAETFWLYSEADGYDLTHPPTPEAPKSWAVIDPKKTALVIIDLQNYFLSPALGRPSDSLGMKVVDQLLEHANPACRKAGIPIVWLLWGLTQEDIEGMPPTILRGFGLDDNFDNDRPPPGLGTDIGPVHLDDGSTIECGKVLMQAEPHDLWIYKNRLSGFWGGTGVEDALKSRGIRTLIFSGCSTDQCVATSLTEALSKSWDCLLPSDGCATTSPKFAQDSVEFKMGGWGFLLSCKDLADGVAKSYS